jgi:8-oxo-dGTP diphosphatase
MELVRRCGADGVHLPSASLMRMTERPTGMLAGASCHDAAELQHAMNLGLDFAVIGPVKPTASHPGAQGIGWARFAELSHGATIPVYAIGGLHRADMESAWSAGAHGVAMISGAWLAQ